MLLFFWLLRKNESILRRVKLGYNICIDAGKTLALHQELCTKMDWMFVRNSMAISTAFLK